MLFDDLHPLVPRPDHDRVDDLLFFGDGERRHVPVGTSREAQHHRIVSFVDAARRYVEHFRRFDRNVVFRIRGGLSRLCRRIRGIGRNRLCAAAIPSCPGCLRTLRSFRRSPDEPDVLIDFVIEQQVFFPAPHRSAGDFVGSVLPVFLFDCAVYLPGAEYAEFSFPDHAVAHFHRFVGNVGDPAQNITVLPLTGSSSCSVAAQNPFSR